MAEKCSASLVIPRNAPCFPTNLSFLLTTSKHNAKESKTKQTHTLLTSIQNR